MICIRIFDTRSEAERAKKVLEDAGFSSTVTEDKFDDVPIQRFGVPARYRLKVKDKDFRLVTAFLAKKIRATRLKK